MKKIFVLVLVLSSCGNSHHNESLRKQAAEIHNLTMDIAGDLEKELQMFAVASPDSVRQLLLELEAWKKTIVEVPGNTHEHHDHGNHSHDHTPPAVTAEEMLRIQEELHEQILALKARVDAWKQK